MVATYGIPVLTLKENAPLLYYQLYLNLDRQLLRQVHAVKMGTEQGVNDSPPTLDQFQAITRTTDEAETLYLREEATRLKAQAFRGGGENFGFSTPPTIPW